MIDIPLEHAQLLWSDDPDAFAIIADYRSQTDRFRNLGNSRGASGDNWARLATDQRMSLLMSIVWSAVIRDGVPAEVMHRALVQVPEYRVWIDGDVSGVAGSENE